MQYEHYYYNCSREYIDLINPNLFEELLNVLQNVPKLTTQAEINLHLHLSLIKRGWSYDTRPSGLKDISHELLNKYGEYEIDAFNNRNLCLTSSTLRANGTQILQWLLMISLYILKCNLVKSKPCLRTSAVLG